MKMYIDDIRFPKGDFDIIVRNSSEAINYVKSNGCPDFISFDHDLGGEDTSMIFIKWLVEQDIDNKIIPENFTYFVHSANPVGKSNIEGYLRCYLKQRN